MSYWAIKHVNIHISPRKQVTLSYQACTQSMYSKQKNITIILLKTDMVAGLSAVIVENYNSLKLWYIALFY